MKLQIELSEEQLQLIINALEIDFRMMMKQSNIVADLIVPQSDLSGLVGTKRSVAFEKYLQKREYAEYIISILCRVVYGEFYEELPDDAARLCDMWTALRHLQWQILNAGKETPDITDVRSGKPFQMSDYRMIRCDVIE